MRKMVIAVIVVIALVFSFTLIASAGSDDKSDWLEYMEAACKSANICPEIVEAVIEKESSWDPDAKNGECIGLMQINPKWYGEMMENLGVTDLTDPYENIRLGVCILADLAKRYEIDGALMFYNAGYSDKYGTGAWELGELSEYATWVLERAAELERLHGK